MRDPACRSVSDLLEEASSPVLPEAVQAHLAACAPCARLVARQRRLESWLEALPPPPVADFAPPTLSEPAAPRPILRLRVLRWAAAAAVVVVAWQLVRTGEEDSGRELARVRIESVIDLPDAPPLVDEQQLVLTAGAEVVAMRRPTEIR